ncbi:copper chaperone CopZ [Gillisia sp. Hel_I_86]|uniref:heavy-metal-associated domain-containing protein n=1 Tax=Gillisia sp. Hel_I_86 TaxID=1249981 RepID=UPI00119A9AAA|nr:heavy-metal-associated domain-containing protein [Gillisia sp. Hel_I_86]TVZ25115.1 copper chaperone CopZ [Gillisia sp. Hel_I_86]
MKNLLIVPILALMLFSFQVKAQSNEATNQVVEAASKKLNSKTVKFKITGITCAGCSNAIYNALKEVEGVLEHSVEYPGDIAVIEFDDSKTSIEALKLVIEKKGYKVELLKDKA